MPPTSAPLADRSSPLVAAGTAQGAAVRSGDVTLEVAATLPRFETCVTSPNPFRPIGGAHPLASPTARWPASPALPAWPARASRAAACGDPEQARGARRCLAASGGARAQNGHHQRRRRDAGYRRRADQAAAWRQARLATTPATGPWVPDTPHRSTGRRRGGAGTCEPPVGREAPPCPTPPTPPSDSDRTPRAPSGDTHPCQAVETCHGVEPPELCGLDGGLR